MKRVAVFTFGLVLAMPVVAEAAPPTKEQCISAFDQAQQLRRSGKLRESREQLLTCSQPACPSMVRADCADVLKQVANAQSTIVLKAADAHGTDLTDVTVELNGQVLATNLDGRAIPVDPGKLALVFKRAPWSPVPVDVVIAEGEKGRIIKATLGPPLPPEERRLLEPAGPPPPPPKRTTAGWAVPVALGTVSVASFIIAGITRLHVGNEADDAKNGGCSPNCTSQQRADWSSELVRTNVFLGIGIGTAVLAAASWFVLAPRRPARSTALVQPTLTW